MLRRTMISKVAAGTALVGLIPAASADDELSPNVRGLDIAKGIRFGKLPSARNVESPYEDRDRFQFFIEEVSETVRTPLLQVMATVSVDRLELEIRRGDEVVFGLQEVAGARVHTGQLVLVRIEFEAPVFTTRDGYVGFHRTNPDKEFPAPYADGYVPLEVTKIRGRFK